MFQYLDNSGNCISSLGLAEGYLQECSLGTAVCALSKSSPTAEPSCSSASETASCHGSQFGTMFGHSTALLGGGEWTSLLADSLVRILAQPDRAKELKALAVDCGGIWREWFAKWDPITSSWKTRQCSLLAGLDEFSVTWPRWGMMQSGVCLERPTQERHISENESGFWPTLNTRGWRGDGELLMLSRMDLSETEIVALTKKAAISKLRRYFPTLTKCGNYNRKGASKTSGDGLATVIGGSPNPEWSEWLMGWPMGWTGLQPLETAKFQSWQQQHGES